MKRKLFRIITKRENDQHNRALYCMEIAVIVYEDEATLDALIRSVSQSTCYNYLGEKITWTLVAYEEVQDTTTLPLEVEPGAQQKLVILSHTFENLRDLYTPDAAWPEAAAS